MATTSFKAELPCSNCGQTNTAWLESQLDDRGKTYEVGDRYDDRISVADFDASCFVVKRPADGESIHAVLSWTCTNCKASNFAEVVFGEGTVTWIEEVELGFDVLDRVHYLSEDTEEMLERIAGEPLRQQGRLRPDWLARLRDGIAAGRRW